MSPIAAMPDTKIQTQTSLGSFRNGVRAVLLGPPGSGKGTQVSFTVQISINIIGGH